MTSRRTCTVTNCDRPVKTGGVCNAHYLQIRKGRTPSPISPRASRSAPDAERFAFYVARDEGDGCWLWTGTRNSRGYGKFFARDTAGAMVYAHRWSYEHHVGPIPDGLVIDHLCRNTSCCNPAHLEAVPQSVNVKRGKKPLTSPLREKP